MTVKLCSSFVLTAGHLQAELAKVNLDLPARVWLPVEKKEHIVLRIPPSAAVCLNSAEKVVFSLQKDNLTEKGHFLF